MSKSVSSLTKEQRFVLILADEEMNQMLRPALEAEVDNPSGDFYPDTIELRWNIKSSGSDAAETGEKATTSQTYSVLFYPHKTGIACFLNGEVYGFHMAEAETENIRKRNEECGILVPDKVQKPLKAPVLSDERASSRQHLKNGAHYTFMEARQMMTALSDGRDLRNWTAIDGMLAMLHSPKDKWGRLMSLQTRFEPNASLLASWGKSVEIYDLEKELKSLEQDAQIEFLTLLGGVLESPTMRVTTTIDEIIEAIGRGSDARRSHAARAQWRVKVWRWLLLFESMSVVGARPGTWREPRDRDGKRAKIDTQQLYSQDVLLKVLGQRGTTDEQGTLDGSEIPKEVVVTAGPWMEQWHGNHEMLAHFGMVRTLAAIPRGKPSGAWATSVGLLLQQLWRERASRTPAKRSGPQKAVVQKFKPFTRRELLNDTWRSDHDVTAILRGNDPSRAKTYWRDALDILKEKGIIESWHELEPLPAGGYGWQDAWLDQPIEILPAAQLARSALEIQASAQKAKKRGRSKKAITGAVLQRPEE